MTTTPPKPKAHKRGEVVLVLFPHSDLLRTAKTRPAPIVQADDLETGLSQVIVAMISGRTFRAGHPSRVPVSLSTPEGGQSGLLTDSVVMTDNLATLTEAAVDRVVGMLPMAGVDMHCATRWGCEHCDTRLRSNSYRDEHYPSRRDPRDTYYSRSPLTAPRPRHHHY